MLFTGFKKYHFEDAPLEQVKQVLQTLIESPEVQDAGRGLFCYVGQQRDRAWLCWFRGKGPDDRRGVPQIVLRLFPDKPGAISPSWLQSRVVWPQGQVVELAFDTEGYVGAWEKVSHSDPFLLATLLQPLKDFQVVLAQKVYDPDDPRPWPARRYGKCILRNFGAAGSLRGKQIRELIDAGDLVRNNNPSHSCSPALVVFRRWESGDCIPLGPRFGEELAGNLVTLRPLLDRVSSV